VRKDDPKVPAPFVVAEPWGVLHAMIDHSKGKTPLRRSVAGSEAVLVAPAEREVQLSPVSGTLPERGPSFDTNQGKLQAFDLPLPGQRLQGAMPLVDGRGDQLGELEIDGHLPRPSRDSRRGENEDGSAEEIPREQALYGFVENLVSKAQGLRWEAERLARGQRRVSRWPTVPLPWDKVKSALMPKDDEPRGALIVQVAQEFGETLSILCDQPRKVLRRVREKTPIGRAQQLDGACLQWLVRQPGRTASEKAGSRQRVLAVVREEDFNTLENRVLKEMLCRCEGMAARWLRANRRHKKHAIFRTVSSFRARCRKNLRTEFLGSVASLTMLPQPNYVLRHEPSYRELWEWYRRVVAQESETDAVWPWQHRLWAETMQVYLTAAMLVHAAPEQIGAQALWLGRRASHGRWTAPVDWPGPVVLQSLDRSGKRIVADCLEPDAVLPDHRPLGVDLARWVGILGASFAVHCSALNAGAERQDVCLLLWPIHTPLRSTDDGKLQLWCEQAAKAMGLLLGCLQEATSEPCLFRGLILVSDPLVDYARVGDFLTATQGAAVVHGLRVQGKPDEWDENFVMALGMVVDECLTLVQ